MLARLPLIGATGFLPLADGEEAVGVAGLPNAEMAYVEERKITEYLLALRHPDGHDKAVFFMRFGFRPENWERLAEALVEHARENELAEREETLYGVQYAVDGPLQAPDGRSPPVRSVWEQKPGGTGPRLITPYLGPTRR
jgi:hypothetical protein